MLVICIKSENGGKLIKSRRLFMPIILITDIKNEVLHFIFFHLLLPNTSFPFSSQYRSFVEVSLLHCWSLFALAFAPPFHGPRSSSFLTVVTFSLCIVAFVCVVLAFISPHGMLPFLTLHTFNKYYWSKHKLQVTVALIATNTLIYLLPSLFDSLIPHIQQV